MRRHLYETSVAPCPIPNFDSVALPHLDAAYNLARWLMRDATEAEDVVQDALLRGLKYFSSFAGGDGRAWLLRIVRNVAYDRLAARRGLATLPLDGDGEERLRSPTRCATPATIPKPR